jgi:hypothetical protein
MASTPLEYQTPRIATKVHRNHFASERSQTPHKPFDLNTVQHTYDSIKRLTARLKAAQKQTGVYRFAIINALRRSRRTYTTYDDLTEIPEYEQD